jgi:hypothetical protein
MTMKITVFWDVTPCSLLDIYRRFRGTCYLKLWRRGLHHLKRLLRSNKILYVTFEYLQEVLGRTNRLLSLLRHGPHWKRRVQQFYCCGCICYRGNVSTEPLPSNKRGIHKQTDIHRQQSDLISLFLLFKNKKGRVKKFFFEKNSIGMIWLGGSGYWLRCFLF